MDQEVVVAVVAAHQHLLGALAEVGVVLCLVALGAVVAFDLLGAVEEVEVVGLLVAAEVVAVGLLGAVEVEVVDLLVEVEEVAVVLVHQMPTDSQGLPQDLGRWCRWNQFSAQPGLQAHLQCHSV